MVLLYSYNYWLHLPALVIWVYLQEKAHCVKKLILHFYLKYCKSYCNIVNFLPQAHTWKLFKTLQAFCDTWFFTVWQRCSECVLISLFHYSAAPQQRSNPSFQSPLSSPPIQPYYQPVPIPVFIRPQQRWNPPHYPQAQPRLQHFGQPRFYAQQNTSKIQPKISLLHTHTSVMTKIIHVCVNSLVSNHHISAWYEITSTKSQCA